MSSINERRRENYRNYLKNYYAELIDTQANNRSIMPENAEEGLLFSILHELSTEAEERIDAEAA